MNENLILFFLKLFIVSQSNFYNVFILKKGFSLSQRGQQGSRPSQLGWVNI